MESTGENQFAATLAVGIGAVKGTYDAKITLQDLTPPSSYTMMVEGNGSTGFVRGEGNIKLEEQAGATVIRVEGDVQIGGPVAMVGQRLMSTLNKQMMDRFFRCIGRAVK